MSTPKDETDEILDLVLAGTPQRVLDVVLARAPGALEHAAGHCAALAELGMALEPVEPSPSLRDAIERRLNALPQAPRRALLVLDMIEDYLTPGRPLHVPRARTIIPAVRTRIEQARRAGERVIFLCDRHEPDDPELKTWPLHAMNGTTGWQVVPELAPQPEDLVVTHRTYSAFFESELDATLRSLQVDSLVLTGCATELGLFATATDALMRGYRVEVPPECQAGASAEAEQVVLGVLHVMRPVERAASAY